MPSISAEAAAEYGLDLARLAIVPADSNVQGAAWTTAVGALLDAVDIVAARPPPRVQPNDIRRLAARVRTREAVLVPYLDAEASWPGADARLTVTHARWSGLGTGYGRLKQRQLSVTAEGRGQAARPRSAILWLPAIGGGAALVEVDDGSTQVTPAAANLTAKAG